MVHTVQHIIEIRQFHFGNVIDVPLGYGRRGGGDEGGLHHFLRHFSHYVQLDVSAGWRGRRESDSRVFRRSNRSHACSGIDRDIAVIAPSEPQPPQPGPTRCVLLFLGDTVVDMLLHGVSGCCLRCSFLRVTWPSSGHTFLRRYWRLLVFPGFS